MTTDRETGQGLTLTKLTPELQSALIEMASEYHAAGEKRYLSITPDMDWESYTALLRRLEAEARDEDLPPGRVPQSVFWLLRDGHTLLGASRLRHRLTPLLEQDGGHITYGIRPAERGKGYGTRLLALTLEKAREIGLTRVLLTCEEDNLASLRIIEKNGGELIDQTRSSTRGKVIRRYWIDLDKRKPQQENE
jgi:predicted acetyltransferase